MPGNTNETAQIEHLAQCERPRPHNVKFYVALQSLARYGDVSEARFAMQAKRHDTPGNSRRGFRGFERRCVGRRVLFNKFRRCSCPLKAMRIWVMAASFDLGKLFLALKILVLRLKR